MFLTETFNIADIRPTHSQISVNDWKVLARYWYPVAIDADIEDKPVASKLLDVELVVYRVDGQVAVARDLCPHRHIRLSAGEIDHDRLICPFHGMEFDGKGQCTKVPALGRDAKLPASYRLKSFRSEVRYGLIWACLDDESSEEIPLFEDAAIADAANKLVFAETHDWPVSSARQMENFFDLAHLPFVHSKSMGGDQEQATPATRIEFTNTGFQFVDPHRERAVPITGEKNFVDSTYVITLPFAIELKTSGSDKWHLHMFNIPTPISAYECRIFMFFIIPVEAPSRKGRPHMGDGAQVTAEDKEILSHLGQPDIPLDARSEIHLPCDRATVEYRKLLKNIGLGRRDTEAPVDDKASQPEFAGA